MDEAATKIQRMFRRRKEGKGMILHLKDLMKRLVEAEKAKVRLNDMLSCMQDETTKYWFSYLNKNIDVSYQPFSLLLFRKLSRSRLSIKAGSSARSTEKLSERQHCSIESSEDCIKRTW